MRSLDVDYTVNASGILSVKETWVWQFGSESGRHGIKRTLVVREPWSEKGKDTDQDAVYTVSNVEVTSPDGREHRRQRSRHASARRAARSRRPTIGSGSETISRPDRDVRHQPTTSRARCAARPNANPPYDELYWDVTGTGTRRSPGERRGRGCPTARTRGR